MSKHTPTPWTRNKYGAGITGRHGLPVSPLLHDDDAAHIVMCVNAHDELVAVLQYLVEYIDVPDARCNCCVAPPCGDCVAYSEIREALADARAALAKVPA